MQLPQVKARLLHILRTGIPVVLLPKVLRRYIILQRLTRLVELLRITQVTQLQLVDLLLQPFRLRLVMEQIILQLLRILRRTILQEVHLEQLQLR